MLSYLYNTTARFFKNPFGIGGGDTQIARLADLNTVIDALNVIADNTVKTIDALFTITGNSAATATVLGGGCPACLGNGTVCGSTKAYGCYSVTASIVYKGTGVYKITFVLPNTVNVPTLATSLSVGNPTTAGFVTVAKIDNLNYTISTYNTSGIAADNILVAAVAKLSVLVDTDNVKWN